MKLSTVTNNSNESERGSGRFAKVRIIAVATAITITGGFATALFSPDYACSSGRCGECYVSGKKAIHYVDHRGRQGCAVCE